MVKKFQRWYEKEESLSTFMNLMENLSPEQQCEIAIDIIMETSELIDREYTSMIKDVANFDPKDYNRWYDKNPTVHLAIESLRDLDEAQRIKIAQQFSDIILNSYIIEGLKK